MLGRGIEKLGGVFSNFDASLLASKFGIFAQQISASSTPTEIVNADSAVGTALLSVVNVVIRFVYYLIYSICRFALNFVDFCEVLVNKLSGISGQNESYSLQKDFEGNPIFRFLTNDTVLTTFLILIGLAIAMVIVFAIIAIIKNEYDAYAEDKSNGKGPIIRRALKSCFLFLVAPIFLFIFVFGSNAILNSVNQAFKSQLGNYSLGGQIFVSSTYQANRYRIYAERGTRAPILFDFEDPAETGFADVMTSEQIANAYSSWEGSGQLYNAFSTQKFDKFSDTIVYKNNKLYNSSNFSGFENFVTTAEEYYLMADFLDYAVGNSLQYYIKPMDDSDIDWAAVKDKIGASLYYSIVNDMNFSVAYSDVSDIAEGLTYYIKEYVNSNGTSSTPLADALSTVSQILAIGNFEGNNFRELERVEGYTNYVRWKSEMAKDSDGTLHRVYTLTKWTYNTTIEELQTREPQTVVLKDGVFYDAKPIVDQLELDAADGKFAYLCDTTKPDTKVDRVAVDTILTYDDGTEYRDNNNQTVVLPKDELAVLYKQVSWPEKLFNDLMVIYGDISIEGFIENGTWDDVVTSSGIVGSTTGAVEIPTAFISPMGIIMSELFLGDMLESEEGTTLSDFYYGSVYDDATVDALIKSIGGEFNYTTLSGQIDAFDRIFNNMMSQILDDAAQKEGVATEDMLDSVSINSYKQYLASILLSDSFAEYFAGVAKDIVLFNQILADMRQTEILKPWNELEYQTEVENVATGLVDGSVAKEALLSYIAGKNPYATTGDIVGGLSELKYSVDSDNYVIRSANDVSFSGKDVAALKTQLEDEREAAISRFQTFGTKGNLEAIQSIDAQLYSIQKCLIVESFREHVAEKTTNSIDVYMNGYSYDVVLTLSTTEIAELAFGNQLKQIAPEFYSSDNSFLYVSPGYAGLVDVEVDDNGTILGIESSFELMKQFLKKFGDISFELNKSNFVEVGFGSSDSVYGDVFYDAFAEFIVGDLFVQFPDLARRIGLVSIENNKFENLGYDTLQNWGFFEGTNIGTGTDWSYNVVSWKIDSIRKSANGEKLLYAIDLSVALTYEDASGHTVTNIVEKTIPNEKLLDELKVGVGYDADQIAALLVDYWGFYFEKSQVGFSYEVFADSQNGIGTYYVVIDGTRFDLEYKNGTWGLNYVNGEFYVADNSSYPKYVPIDGELVGKTLIDYRRDALLKIVALDTRAGETEEELSERFLSMFYFLCSNYENIEVDENGTATSAKLVTDTFSKSLVKELSGVLNRPDHDLVGKEYETDFGVYEKDEQNGTVFVICTFDKATEKYVPFLVATNNSSKKDFYSKYVVNPYGNEKLYFPVVAKGIIDEDGNPTAIRENANGDIEFYRDDIYVVNASKMGIEMYYQSVEDVKVQGSIVSSIVNGVTQLFAGKTLTQLIVEKIPRLSADLTLNFAYGSKMTTVATVKDGYLPMSYDFSVLGIESFYSVENLNIIILLSGTILLVTAMFYAVWGLIQRILDVVALFLVAPPVIATIPLGDDDTGGKFVAWRDKVVSSVLSVYGIVVGLNAFFLFVPYINTLEFFEPGSVGAESVMQNGILRHFGDINFVNYLFRVLFLWGAIGLVRRAPKMFAPLITPGDDQDIFSKGEATVANVRAAVDTVKDHVSGQYVMDKASKIAGTVSDMIPGKAIAQKVFSAGGKMKDKMQSKALELYARAHGVPKDVAKQAAKNLNDSMSRKRKQKQEAKEARRKELEEREAQRAKR